MNSYLITYLRLSNSCIRETFLISRWINVEWLASLFFFSESIFVKIPCTFKLLTALTICPYSSTNMAVLINVLLLFLHDCTKAYTHVRTHAHTHKHTQVMIQGKQFSNFHSTLETRQQSTPFCFNTIQADTENSSLMHQKNCENIHRVET